MEKGTYRMKVINNVLKMRRISSELKQMGKSVGLVAVLYIRSGPAGDGSKLTWSVHKQEQYDGFQILRKKGGAKPIPIKRRPSYTECELWQRL